MDRTGPHQIIAITDSRICKGDLLERIELLAQSGVKAIILREKQLEASEYRALAQKSLAICARAGVACILHSFIEVARELKASALHCQSSQIAHLPHLRQEFATLGVSVHSVEEYRAAREWVDYVIVGHIFASACKEGVEPKGLKLLESIIAIAKDSVLGEQCGSVAKIVKGTTAKVANLPQFLQSSLVPTAIPRILEEYKEAGRENSTILESQSSFTKQTENLESTFEKQAECEKVDSSPALQGLYAIGGISLETLPALANMPISGVCMRQALMQATNPQDYIHRCRLISH
ncbi:thiamine phosphate synthase [uncultured Helicobacter sp.]|uniref:thiamine phosphate synthase n=1 Tax=uncultured Helicobacter sp. TaxID=175537 RepID=UPI00262495F1|nr:thiamine phosphate synthase [uncultured Helicobacter sp.]